MLALFCDPSNVPIEVRLRIQVDGNYNEEQRHLAIFVEGNLTKDVKKIS